MRTLLLILLYSLFQPLGLAILYKDGVENLKSNCDLKQIGTTLQVDKVDSSHRYEGLYCTLLQPLRHLELKMLEIGFGCAHRVKGRGAVMWKRYSAAADYYAIDYIAPNKKHPLRHLGGEERCMKKFKEENPLVNMTRDHIMFGDQANTTFLKEVTTAYTKISPTFDIIIDDGGHFCPQIVASLLHLWPFISPGGPYIIEDLNKDPEFSKIMGAWTTLIAAKSKERNNPSKKLEYNVPKGVLEMGCSYQICYFRKALNTADLGNKALEVTG
jgi:hypothetical protein